MPFEPGEVAIFARLPLPGMAPPPTPALRALLGRRVLLLGRSSGNRWIAETEDNSSVRFFLPEDSLDRTDDRAALIREYWRNHREVGLRALRRNGPFVAMIRVGGDDLPTANYGPDILPPVAMTTFESVEYRLDVRMRRRPEYRVMCGDEEIERLNNEVDLCIGDISIAHLSQMRIMENPRCPGRSVSPELVRRLADDMRQQIEDEIIGVLTGGDTGAAVLELVRALMGLVDRMQARIAAAYRIPARYLRGPDAAEDRAAVAMRSIALLREWLSPAQLEQFDRRGNFDVVGGETRTVYRINAPGAFNIHVLGPHGGVVDRLCVAPQLEDFGEVPPGDVLLAQKIGLEKNEAETLRVANRYSEIPSRLRPPHPINSSVQQAGT